LAPKTADISCSGKISHISGHTVKMGGFNRTLKTTVFLRCCKTAKWLTFFSKSTLQKNSSQVDREKKFLVLVSENTFSFKLIHNYLRSKWPTLIHKRTLPRIFSSIYLFQMLSQLPLCRYMPTHVDQKYVRESKFFAT